MANVIDKSGNIYALPDEELGAAQAQGYRIATDEEIARYDKRKLYSGRLGEVAAFTGGAADSLTFGAFKPALRAISPDTAEGLDLAQEANPVAAGAGTVGGVAGCFVSPLMRGATAVGQKALAQTGSRTAQFAAEGATMAAPKATTQLLTGDYEEAAETLLAGGGLGAGFGAIAGGLERAVSVAKPYAAMAGKYVGEKVAEAANNQWGKAAGMQKSIRNKMTQQDYDEWVGFIKEKIFSKGLFQNKAQMLEDAQQAKRVAGEEIGGVLQKLDSSGFYVSGDDAIETAAGIKVPKFRTKSAVAKAQRDAIADLKTIVEDERRHFAEPGPRARFTKLFEYKQTVAEKRYNEEGRKLLGPVARFHEKLERRIDDLIAKGFDDAEAVHQSPMNQRGLFASPTLPGGQAPAAAKSEWLEAKRLYKNWSRTIKPLQNLINVGSNKALGIGDYATVGIGGALGGVPGAILGYIFSEAKDQFGSQVAAATLDRALRSSREVGTQIQELAKRAIESPTTTAFRVNSLGTLARLAGTEDRHEATEKVVSELSRFVTNPHLAAEQMSQSVSELSQADPKLAETAQQKILQAAQVLLEMAPRRDAPESPFESSNGQYTNSQVSDFERQLAVALNPLAAMEDLAQGTLDPSSMTVLQKLYPKLYARMQTAIIDSATEEKRAYTYGQKLNLSLFFGKEVDSLGAPQNIKVLQQSFVKDKDEVSKSGKKMSFAEDTQTTAQRIENR